MIFTITTSPSLDLKYEINAHLIQGETYRAIAEDLRPGGKGINISIMLKNLGVVSTALGFVAGFSGDELMRLTAQVGIKTGFIRAKRGRTRINIRLFDNEDVTKINGLGPIVDENDIIYLLKKIETLTEGDFLVIAGMLPPSLPQDIYARFCKAVQAKGVKVILDIPANMIEPLLSFNPFLVKPNLRELSEFLNTKLDSDDSIINAALRLQDLGAENVLVSMGAQGAIFIGNDKKPLRICAPDGKTVDKTGAGDSAVAGFIAKYLETGSTSDAAIMAVATGTASAFSEKLATLEEAEKLFNILKQNV